MSAFESPTILQRLATLSLSPLKHLSDFFLKMGQPWPLYNFFLSKHTLQLLQQINVKKCPSSIRWRDLKSQPPIMDVSWIRTLFVRVEGEHADHLTTNKVLISYPHVLRNRIHQTFCK